MLEEGDDAHDGDAMAENVRAEEQELVAEPSAKCVLLWLLQEFVDATCEGFVEVEGEAAEYDLYFLGGHIRKAWRSSKSLIDVVAFTASLLGSGRKSGGTTVIKGRLCQPWPCMTSSTHFTFAPRRARHDCLQQRGCSHVQCKGLTTSGQGTMFVSRSAFPGPVAVPIFSL